MEDWGMNHDIILMKVSSDITNWLSILTCCELRKLAYKIIHSTIKILPAWYACLEELKMDHCTIPQDVSTHWNSTFDMLNIALQYCKATNAISVECNLQLQPFEFSNIEWNIAEQLWDILKVSSHLPPCSDISIIFATHVACQILKDATLFFSQSTPNLATVISTMDILDERLTNNSLNHTRFNVSIHASLGVTKQTLNHYYNMTDWSEVHRIAMGKLYIFCCLVITCWAYVSFASLTQTCIFQGHRVSWNGLT